MGENYYLNLAHFLLNFMFFKGWHDAGKFPSVYGCPGGGKSLKEILSINSTYLSMCYLWFITPEGYRWVETKVYDKDHTLIMERRPLKIELTGSCHFQEPYCSRRTAYILSFILLPVPALFALWPSFIYEGTGCWCCFWITNPRWLKQNKNQWPVQCKWEAWRRDCNKAKGLSNSCQPSGPGSPSEYCHYIPSLINYEINVSIL